MEYSELVRARSVRRMVGPGAISATELSRETGIPQPTLSRWLRGAASLRLVSSKPEPPNESDTAVAEKRPQDWSSKERLQLLVEADRMMTKTSASCFVGAVFTASSSTRGARRSTRRSRSRVQGVGHPRRSASRLVGWAVHDVQSDALAADLVDATCAREGIVRDQLALHADNGGAMKGKTMLVKLEQLGVVPSFSRPRVSDDNPFPEALFRTLKYRPGYPDKPFASVEDARRWVAAFVGWYNDEHQHSGIRFVTPSQRHAGHDTAILTHRDEVYRAARRRRPDRWSRGTRNWKPIATVRLNPEHGINK